MEHDRDEQKEERVLYMEEKVLWYVFLASNKSKVTLLTRVSMRLKFKFYKKRFVTLLMFINLKDTVETWIFIHVVLNYEHQGAATHRFER